MRVRSNPVNPLPQTVSKSTVRAIRVVINGGVAMVFRPNEIWRNDGMFTTKFTRFLTEHLKPGNSVQFSDGGEL